MPSGLRLGYFLQQTINRISLPSGLYPLLALSGGILIFGRHHCVERQRILAVYLCGFRWAIDRIRNRQPFCRTSTGWFWLAQIDVLKGLW